MNIATAAELRNETEINFKKILHERAKAEAERIYKKMLQNASIGVFSVIDTELGNKEMSLAGAVMGIFDSLGYSTRYNEGEDQNGYAQNSVTISWN